MEFISANKPFPIMRAGKVVLGRPSHVSLAVGLESQQEWKSVRNLQGKHCEQGQSRTFKNKLKPAKANQNKCQQVETHIYCSLSLTSTMLVTFRSSCCLLWTPASGFREAERWDCMESVGTAIQAPDSYQQVEWQVSVTARAAATLGILHWPSGHSGCCFTVNTNVCSSLLSGHYFSLEISQTTIFNCDPTLTQHPRLRFIYALVAFYFTTEYTSISCMSLKFSLAH